MFFLHLLLSSSSISSADIGSLNWLSILNWTTYQTKSENHTKYVIFTVLNWFIFWHCQGIFLNFSCKWQSFLQSMYWNQLRPLMFSFIHGFDFYSMSSSTLLVKSWKNNKINLQYWKYWHLTILTLWIHWLKKYTDWIPSM